MFGFLRKNSHPAGPALSSAAPGAVDVTAEVTTDVTAPVTTPEFTAECTAAVTADVTTEVTTSTVASSRIVEKWAEPKPFPPPEGRPVQFWPDNALPSPRAPSAKQIAEELFAAMQRQPMCVGQWVLALSIEAVIYPIVCQQLGWPPRPWMGKNGVAFHFGRLSGRRPEYKRTEIDGEAHNLLHYYIPHPQVATVPQIANHRRRKA